jgi:hypothetical protein
VLCHNQLRHTKIHLEGVKIKRFVAKINFAIGKIDLAGRNGYLPTRQNQSAGGGDCRPGGQNQSADEVDYPVTGQNQSGAGRKQSAG